MEINTTELSQVEVTICENGMSLCDDIIMTRYIAKSLANGLDLEAVFNNKINHDVTLNKTKCIFDFYTNEMMNKDNGYVYIQKLVAKLKKCLGTLTIWEL